MKTIYIVNPLITKEFEEMTLREAKAAASPETRLQVVSIDKGPASIECRYDEVIAGPYVVKKVREVVDKADAIIINCFDDPGVEAAREVTHVPIVGPGSSSMALAQLLGRNFSVVTVFSRLVPLIEEIARKLGTSKLVSIRVVSEPPVIESVDGVSTVCVLPQEVIKESIKAIEEDEAEVIVLGGTCMAGLGDQIKDGLGKRHYDVPVIDSALVALKLAEILADMKISHSKLTYPQPPEKERTGGD